MDYKTYVDHEPSKEVLHAVSDNPYDLQFKEDCTNLSASEIFIYIIEFIYDSKK